MSSDKLTVSTITQLKLFSIGIIIGCIAGILWQELLSPIRITPNMTVADEYNVLKSDAEDRLLKYIEGHWQSSIGDVLISIGDGSIGGSFIVIESFTPSAKNEETYKIVKIERVDAFLGIVGLQICNVNNNCNTEDKVSIQINKIFGIDKTISLTYDTRLTKCIPVDNHCTRAFKQID